MQNTSVSVLNTSTISSECVPFVIQPEPWTLDTAMRFALEGVLLPIVGIAGVVGAIKISIYTMSHS